MITVLRLGHRRGRDDRISTHVGLTARQFGAGKVVYAGEKDENMLESLRDVVERWGGPFSVEYREDWRTVIKEFEGDVIHLSMYSTPYSEVVPELREKRGEEDLLVVVGGEKVPSDVFELADYNLAVGSQPHSEVAALAVFLHEFFEGEIREEFEDAEVEVVSSEDGKETQEV